ncbi:MAG: hypothetical protein GWN56_18170, partial [Nitrosopumilaceae archaeon]|nr:hypothetical protein [Nitrosopumilaceae archaeon]
MSSRQKQRIWEGGRIRSISKPIPWFFVFVNFALTIIDIPAEDISYLNASHGVTNITKARNDDALSYCKHCKDNREKTHSADPSKHDK